MKKNLYFSKCDSHSKKSATVFRYNALSSGVNKYAKSQLDRICGSGSNHRVDSVTESSLREIIGSKKICAY